jgi:hypothetical protein
MNPDEKLPILSNAAYDMTRTFITIVLPLISALYFALWLAFDFPAVEYVLGGLAVLELIYGWTYNASRKRYLASDRGIVGEFVVKQDGGGAADYLLVLHADPEVLEEEQRITFKVLQRQAN